jgi:hypothetical protein
MMSLSQLGNTHSGGNAFDSELDTMQHSSLAPIPLNDFSADFGKFPFDSDHHSDHEPKIFRTIFFWRCVGNENFRDVRARGAAYVAQLVISIEQGTCR